MSEPANTSNNSVPNMRSNNTSSRATVMTGNENTMRNMVTSVPQANMGMRMRLMPGARMLRMVTMKLKPDTSVPIPVISRPMVQKSTPRPGLYSDKLYVG